MPSSDVAPGWTDNEDDLSNDFYWSSSSGTGSLNAALYGLKNCIGRMRNTRRGGGDMYIFQSDNDKGDLYLWNLIDSSMWKITKPSGLSNVILAIKNKDGDLSGLTVEELTPTAEATN